MTSERSPMASERSPRLAKLDHTALDPAQRALYDAIVDGPRALRPFPLTDAAGNLEGPFNAMLLSPVLGEALQALGAAIRYRSALSVRAREIATLVVARVWESAFEWYAHEAIARSVGFDQDEIDTLRDQCVDGLTDPGDRLVAATATALAARGDLTDQEFAAALDGLGAPGVFELMTLVGYYATLALQLRVFRVGAPGDARPDPEPADRAPEAP